MVFKQLDTAWSSKYYKAAVRLAGSCPVGAPSLVLQVFGYETAIKQAFRRL